MGNKNKKGRQLGAFLHAKKQVSPNVAFNLDSSYFTWSFEKIEREHACWQLEGLFVIETIISKLKSFETMTWAEIKSQSGGKTKGKGTNNHFIQGNKLPKEYQKVFIEREYMRDYEKVFSLRIDARKRLIGIVDRNVFFILWYDEDHSIFPTMR